MTGVSGRSRGALCSHTFKRTSPSLVRKPWALYVVKGGRCVRLAASLLRSICVRRLANLKNLALAAEHVLTAFALVECLAGDNAVDFCGVVSLVLMSFLERRSMRGSSRRKWRCARIKTEHTATSALLATCAHCVVSLAVCSEFEGGGAHTGKDVLESKLDVAGVQGRRLDEREVVLAYASHG
jgi:hypothetical protein